MPDDPNALCGYNVINFSLSSDPPCNIVTVPSNDIGRIGGRGQWYPEPSVLYPNYIDRLIYSGKYEGVEGSPTHYTECDVCGDHVAGSDRYAYGYRYHWPDSDPANNIQHLIEIIIGFISAVGSDCHVWWLFHYRDWGPGWLNIAEGGRAFEDRMPIGNNRTEECLLDDDFANLPLAVSGVAPRTDNFCLPDGGENTPTDWVLTINSFERRSPQ